MMYHYNVLTPMYCRQAGSLASRDNSQGLQAGAASRDDRWTSRDGSQAGRGGSSRRRIQQTTLTDAAQAGEGGGGVLSNFHVEGIKVGAA